MPRNFLIAASRFGAAGFASPPVRPAAAEGCAAGPGCGPFAAPAGGSGGGGLLTETCGSWPTRNSVVPKISVASTQLDLNLFTTSSSASVRTGGVPPPGNRPPSALIRVERIAARSGLREFFGSADRNFQYRKRKFTGPLWRRSLISRRPRRPPFARIDKV